MKTSLIGFGLGMLALYMLVGSLAAASNPDGVPFIWHEPALQNRDLTFEPYTLGSNEGSIVVDGKLTHDDSLGMPFNRVMTSGDTLTRTVPVTGWVKDDGHNLYVAIDVAFSKSAALAKEDASVFIKQPQGIAELRLSSLSPDFGRSGGFETPKAKRQHQIFEFKIPLKGLRAERGSLEIAFAANSQSKG